MIPGLPFLPFASSTVQVAAGGITAASIAADARGQIKFLQRGTITIANGLMVASANLSQAVDIAQTEVRMLGYSGSAVVGANSYSDHPRLALDPDGDSLTATRESSAGTACVVSYEVTERY